MERSARARADGFRSYADLDVWRLGMEIARKVYEMTAAFPPDERFGLAAQMRRAAVSIPSNLAEGHARSTTAEFQRFIMVSMGSLAELETQLVRSTHLRYTTPGAADQLSRHLGSLGRMLRALHRSLRRRKERSSNAAR